MALAFIEIEYSLWPIWCDYLEEQGQDTELLRYILLYQCFPSCNLMSIGEVFDIKFYDNYGEDYGLLATFDFCGNGFSYGYYYFAFFKVRRPLNWGAGVETLIKLCGTYLI